MPHPSTVAFWAGASLFLAATLLLIAIDPFLYSFVHANWNHETRPVPELLKLPHRLLRTAENWGENVLIVCVAIAMWQFDRRNRSRVVLLFLAAALTAGTVEGIKRLTGRERPEAAAGRSIFHGPTHWNEGGDYHSFPSGHAAAGASYSGSLAAFYPPIRPVVVALAVGCAGNRIWKERHFASDCFVSLVLGFWIATTLPNCLWARRLANWIDGKFSVSADLPPTGSHPKLPTPENRLERQYSPVQTATPTGHRPTVPLACGHGFWRES